MPWLWWMATNAPGVAAAAAAAAEETQPGCGGRAGAHGWGRVQSVTGMSTRPRAGPPRNARRVGQAARTHMARVDLDWHGWAIGGGRDRSNALQPRGGCDHRLHHRGYP